MIGIRKADLIIKQCLVPFLLQIQILIYPGDLLEHKDSLAVLIKRVAQNVGKFLDQNRNLMITRLDGLIVDTPQCVADKMCIDLRFQRLHFRPVLLLQRLQPFLILSPDFTVFLFDSIRHAVILLRQLPDLILSLYPDLTVIISPLSRLQRFRNSMDRI